MTWTVTPPGLLAILRSCFSCFKDTLASIPETSPHVSCHILCNLDDSYLKQRVGSSSLGKQRPLTSLHNSHDFRSRPPGLLEVCISIVGDVNGA